MFDKSKYQIEPFVYVIDGDLSYLKRRLKKGNQIFGRIVLCLGNNKYLLRIFGFNLVMQSKLAFNRFDEVNLTVKQVFPNLVLSVADSYQFLEKRKGNISGAGKMDLLV